MLPMLLLGSILGMHIYNLLPDLFIQTLMTATLIFVLVIQSCNILINVYREESSRTSKYIMRGRGSGENRGEACIQSEGEDWEDRGDEQIVELKGN